MKRTLRTSGLLVLAALLFSAPLPVLAAPKETVKIGGTGAALGTLRIVADEFQKDAQVAVDIAPSMGSSGGIKAVASRALDLAVSGRPMSDEERAWGLKEQRYAQTLFVPVAHPSVPAGGLSRADIIGALLGSFSTWPNGERVRFILRPESDTDSRLLRGLSPEVSRAVDAARRREGMIVAMTDQQNAEIIERTPGAIGFASLSVVVSERHAVKVLAFDGIRAEDPAYRSLDLTKPLYVISRDDLSTGARSFLQYLLSSQGGRILERTGNIPTEAGPGSR
jgi:phosphate transport system substrate-binding protein